MMFFTKVTVDDQVICEMCRKLQKKQHGREQQQDQAPVKDEALLAACGAGLQLGNATMAKLLNKQKDKPGTLLINLHKPPLPHTHGI